MHPQTTTPPSPEPIRCQDRAGLLAMSPRVGKERPAIHVHAAAIYARESDPRRQDSIPQQLEAGRRYAARIGVPVLYELQDGMSGLSVKRKDYQRLIQLAQDGRISHLILFEAKRFGRDDAEFVSQARKLLRLGVAFHDSTVGELRDHDISLHAFLANSEARAISVNVTHHMALRAEKGAKFGRPRLGYRRTLTPGVWEEDPVTGPAIRELFQRYAAGEGIRSLTRWLNATLGLSKHPSSLYKLLDEPTYKGVSVGYRERNSKIDGRYARPPEEWVFIKVTPIIDEHLWARVQARRSSSSRTGQHHEKAGRYAMRGLLWCASCNLRMTGNACSGAVTLYRCSKCGASRSQRRIERTVRAAVEQLPIGRNLPATALAAQDDEETADVRRRLIAANERLEALTKRRAQLTIDLAEKKTTPEDYYAALALTDGERAALRQECQTLESQLADRTNGMVSVEEALARLSDLRSWTDILDNRTPDELRAFYALVIQRIVWDPGSITLTVHWLPGIGRVLGQKSYSIVLASRAR